MIWTIEAKQCCKLCFSGDGSCFYMRETSSTVIELTGPDCDAVYKVVVEGDHVFTACRDGAIRKYRHVS